LKITPNTIHVVQIFPSNYEGQPEIKDLFILIFLQLVLNLEVAILSQKYDEDF
jgi:hypothetical protein